MSGSACQKGARRCAVASTPLGLALLVLLGGAPARAQTRITDAPTAREPARDRSRWQLDSDTTFVAYEIRSPRSPVTWQRRRLVQRVGYEHVLLAGDLERPWRLSVRLDLRLDQDFGEVCLREDEERCLAERVVAARRDHQLLARPTRLDMPQAVLELRAPVAGLRIQLGRHVLFDVTGLLRLDGGRVELRPHRWVDAEVYAGRQVRDGSWLASSGLEVPGSMRVPLPDDLAPERVPWASEPAPTWAVGGRVAVGDARVVKARLTFRELQEDGALRDRGDRGLVARRVGVGLTSRPLEPLTLRADAVWDPTDGTLVDAMGEVALRRGGGAARARVERHVPRFDLGSIWAWFDLVPVDQGQLLVDATLGRHRRWTLGGAARGRRSKQGQTTQRDVGGEAWLRHRRAGWSWGARGWLWAGDLAPAAAVFLDATRRFAWAQAWARASLWHFDHPFQSALYGTSVALALGGAIDLGALAKLRFELEWAHNRIVGHRTRALAALTLRAWR
ncbi:MAG: hypothetical protein CMN29_27470 [Sandaracinus sp.]|nr:hypothetical protein [Sandaracinus sp.]